MIESIKPLPICRGTAEYVKKKVMSILQKNERLSPDDVQKLRNLVFGSRLIHSISGFGGEPSEQQFQPNKSK